MAKKVFHSNHIEKLLEKLIAKINGPQTNIFTKDWIITPTSGMGQWIDVYKRQVMTTPPNVRYAETFVELARKARKRKLGLWNETTLSGNEF